MTESPERRGRNLPRWVAGVALTLAAVAGLAQQQSGNIYGRCVDEQQAVLPGVSITLEGGGAPQTTFTDAKGAFHFLNLAPGSEYVLTAVLQGFSTVRRERVSVTLGKNTDLTIPMALSAVAATVTVSGDTPLLDTRKTDSGHTFTQSELTEIPTARDPWVILQQSPGVLVDRVNVGGSQGGQQSNYVGKGTDGSQNSWNVDGVVITDMAALGASPTYYDFDAFEEMQVTTGGTDPSVSVPGVTLNMVTKRGTNTVHGSTRVFITDEKFQSTNIPQEAIDQGITKTNRISGIQDYGVEAGGPIVPDKIWLWGSYGRSQINLQQTGGALDRTTLENESGKLNIQPISSNSATLFFFRGDKIKQGRSAGPTRPQETSWDQSGPTTIWKGQDEQVFGTTSVLEVSWSYPRNTFALTPEGGLNIDAYRDANRVWHNSYLFYSTDRPSHQVAANGSFFAHTGSLGHEIKYGFGYRTLGLSSITVWPGTGNVVRENLGQVYLTRPKILNASMTYWDGFIGDTVTANNLTVNFGVRYDEQYGHNDQSIAPANPLFPELLGQLDYPGGPSEFKWKNWQPRVGATYAFGKGNKTVARASYSRFADQLGTAQVSFDNPNGYYPILRYEFHDLNGDHMVERGELGNFVGANYVDPSNPNSASSPNITDPNLKAPITDEFMAGLDQEILPQFVAGLTYTHRIRKDLIYTTFPGYTSADYVQIDPATLDPSECTPGTHGGCLAYDYLGHVIGESGPIYGVANYTGNSGLFQTNRPGYRQTYDGVELQATKRLSDRWMAHASFTWSNWRQNKGECFDPTNSVQVGSPVTTTGSNSCADDIAYYGGAGIGGNFANVYINSKWSFNINGLYQLPLGFNLAANFFGRQGYPIPYFVEVETGDGTPTSLKDVAVGKADDFRNKSVYQLDMRLEKTIPLFSNQANLTFSADVFNLLNSGTVLQVQNASGVANQIFEIQSPRVIRFGARLSF
ncbi:MAG TPA: TonB-dependent receptor [Thermoanaerobaculia bacterium]|nr:TonB-dependent receptor [Thermoanaerobaculia bacterium]